MTNGMVRLNLADVIMMSDYMQYAELETKALQAVLAWCKTQSELR